MPPTHTTRASMPAPGSPWTPPCVSVTRARRGPPPQAPARTGRRTGGSPTSAPHLAASRRAEGLCVLVLCSCGHRGGLAEVDRVRSYDDGDLADCYPHAIERAALPPGVPEGVEREYREAELCASHGAWRGASALLR